MGGKANRILTSFRKTEVDQALYQRVKDRFDAYFVARKTKMYSRAQLNNRTQQPGESIDDFITDVHAIAQKCEYGD